MSNDIFKPKDNCPDKLTKEQKRHLRWAHENAEGLADPDGGWQNDLASVVETGSMIAWQLEQVFPFLAEGEKDE